MKVVINRCYGGFGLSREAVELYFKLAGRTLYVEETDHRLVGCHYYTKPRGEREDENDGYFSDYQIDRRDPLLVEVVEKLGRKADGFAASLRVVDIPDNVEWEVEEYDGMEWVAEKHRTWS